ncbi:glycosyltransferase family 2 protein [Sulfurovum sp. zt1-1]|uniref:Glycosyltransferase family 2 protein n=1 Tax=Sulfurovum zhangzhouensis TaxID=3019067 RepID=A0ABT7QWS0_9BACT|nr:glycosyltransferase family 2 protein [Sulfurovum zhangzhouensis]MDM5271270.1 glycosyltransferase family 2 protein [Sulfurovum zhangzhouensis]
MKNPFNYFTHKFDPSNFTLVMTILVKNEADIIETNIRTHAALGVDAFVVMDNDSTDGTREILAKLQNEFEITIYDEKEPYNQKKFMTKLAFKAKDLYNADWIINNDADEFWIPNDGLNLKNHLKYKGGVLRVARSNMILHEGIKNWWESKYQVINQINYRFGEPNIILGHTARKTIVNPHGLIKINAGNHSAEHIALLKKKEINDIHVYHYPIRSYKQFESTVLVRKNHPKNKLNNRFGTHYRRWIQLYDEGKLEEEYNNFIFKHDEVSVMKKINLLGENTLPAKIINSIIN